MFDTQQQLAAYLASRPDVQVEGMDEVEPQPAKKGRKNTVSGDATAALLQDISLVGLPLPEVEYRFDRTRKWRADLAWPSRKIAVEIEGGAWTNGRHVRGKGFVDDIEKYNRMAVLGYRLLRFTPEMVKDGTAVTGIMEILGG